jgi:hypothetical protein
MVNEWGILIGMRAEVRITVRRKLRRIRTVLVDSLRKQRSSHLYRDF